MKIRSKTQATKRVSKRRPTSAAPAARPRTGGRSARVVTEVLAATLSEFTEQGYGGLSFEAVAARAGVNKTTIYRRWPTKAELLGAALVSLRDDDPPPPDTGSLREDLLQVLRHWVTQAVTPQRRAIMQSLLLANTEPDMQTIVQRLRAERPAIPDVVFERALKRGELPRGTDVQLLRGVLLGTLHSRITLKRQSLEARYLPALVELVVAGARAGGAISR